MSKKKKIAIIVSVVVAVLVIIAIAITVWYMNRPKEPQEIDNLTKEVVGKYTTTLEDGSKLNTSSKLKENKKLDGLDITELQLREQGQMTRLTGVITNNTNEVKGNYVAEITFVNSKGEELTTMRSYIKKLKPNESTKLDSSMTFDYSNTYNIKIQKQKNV